MNRKLWEKARITKVFYSISNATIHRNKKKHSEIISSEEKNRKRETYILPKPFQMAGKQKRHANASGKLLPFLSLVDVRLDFLKVGRFSFPVL